MLIHIAITPPNLIRRFKGFIGRLKLELPKNRSLDRMALRFLGYSGEISSLTGLQGSPIIQDVPPTLSFADGLFVMLIAVFEAKGSYAFRASPSSGCRNGSEGRDWCAYGRMILK